MEHLPPDIAYHWLSYDVEKVRVWEGMLSPEEQQRVLHGIYAEGKTYQQVADDTGLPLGTMKRRLRDALATLRRRFSSGLEQQ